jgi:CRP/FNR family transcriptional regulator, dissimilatory nitrate respiration regulator
MDTKSFSLLRNLSIFDKFSDDTLNDIVLSVNIKKLKKHSIIYLKDKSADNIYVILEGVCKLYTKNKSIRLLKTNDAFGEISLIEKSVYPCNALTETDTVLVEIPAYAFQNQMKKDPSFRTVLINFLLIIQCKLKRHIEYLLTKNSTDKVKQFFIDNVEERSEVNHFKKLQYPNALAANFLGIAPETFSRAITKLQIKTTRSSRKRESNRLYSF